jgi:hypothetical protein
LGSLECSSNKLTSLDISKCNYLYTLKCSNNQLTSLNLTGATILSIIDCSFNLLTSLDITQSDNYTAVFCNNNLPTTMDFGSAPELYYINCMSNHLYGVEAGIIFSHVRLLADGDGYVGFQTKPSGEIMKLTIQALPAYGAAFTGWYHSDGIIFTEAVKEMEFYGEY